MQDYQIKLVEYGIREFRYMARKLRSTMGDSMALNEKARKFDNIADAMEVMLSESQ